MILFRMNVDNLMRARVNAFAFYPRENLFSRFVGIRYFNGYDKCLACGILRNRKIVCCIGKIVKQRIEISNYLLLLLLQHSRVILG